MEIRRALDVLQRAQSEPDQPPPAGEGEDERARGHASSVRKRVCNVLF